ncbi:inositol monophosphatase family protein [Agarivorans sp. Z349TD_8]|uniref:inositol monophosphatase family protein n=1 Tax=Agarivorans sp. Z349TD_8 TaxID=3421434 RepID=UPI003D7E20CE
MLPEQFDHQLKVALSIAEQAGAIALQWFAQRDALIISSKGHHDWVSQADQLVEQYIREALQTAFPEQHILGEESGGEFCLPCWVVDPIDGTTNFLYGQADFVVSIALVDQQGPVLGIIYAPVHQRMFYAVRGQGAFERKASQLLPLQSRAAAQQQLVIGLNLNYQAGIPERYLRHSQQVIAQGHQVRVSGSAAWTLTQVACGELDACYMGQVNIWDVMAAQFICELAGLEIAPYLSKQMTGPVWAWPKGSPLATWLNHEDIIHPDRERPEYE